MKKQLPAQFLATLLVFSIALTGCKKNKETETETETSVHIVFGDTYTSFLADQSFYVMRIGDDYVRLPGTGYTVMADEDGELPDLEDGQFAYITADLKDIYNDFGFVPSHTYYITSISSEEYLSYDEIVEHCDIPELGTTEMYSLFQYTKNDQLYLLVLHGNVFAYTDDGLFAEYERPNRGDPFEPFLKDMGE